MPPYPARSTGVLAIVVLLLAALLLAVRGLNLALEFSGGLAIQVRYTECRPAIESVQAALDRAALADASVEDVSAYPSYFFVIFPPRDGLLSEQSARHVVQQVVAALSTEPCQVEATEVDIVAPTLAREILLSGLAALGLVCIAIPIYSAVRHGWPAAMAHIRNMAIALGLFLSAYAAFQWEFSLRSLAAMGFLAILVAGAGAVYASRARRS